MSSTNEIPSVSTVVMETDIFKPGYIKPGQILNPKAGGEGLVLLSFGWIDPFNEVIFVSTVWHPRIHFCGLIILRGRQSREKKHRFALFISDTLAQCQPCSLATANHNTALSCIKKQVSLHSNESKLKSRRAELLKICSVCFYFFFWNSSRSDAF